MHRLSMAVIAASLAGCGALPSIPVPTIPGVTPYRMEIQQGNYVSQEMVDQLKPGMTREQVRFVLGTPLVADIFHADRWDYVYFRDIAGKPREQRKLSVFFEDGKLARVAGDTMPATAASEPSKPAKPAVAPEAAAKTEPAPQPVQNWSAASDQPPPPQAAPEAAKPAAEAPPKAEDEKPRRSILDRLLGRE